MEVIVFSAEFLGIESHLFLVQSEISLQMETFFINVNVSYKSDNLHLNFTTFPVSAFLKITSLKCPYTKDTYIGGGKFCSAIPSSTA